MNSSKLIKLTNEYGTFSRTTARKYQYLVITTGRSIESRRSELERSKANEIKYAAKYRRVIEAAEAEGAKYANEIDGGSYREAKDIEAGKYTKGQILFADEKPDSYEGCGYHSVEQWKEFETSTLAHAAEADGKIAALTTGTKYFSVQWSSRLDLAVKYAQTHRDQGYENVRVISLATGQEVEAPAIRISADSPFVGGPKSWAPEVIADNSGKWAGNGLRFATKAEAEANVHNLSCRWFLVRETRVVESTDEPNYRWTERGLEAIENLCPLCGERRGVSGTHKC